MAGDDEVTTTTTGLRQKIHKMMKHRNVWGSSSNESLSMDLVDIPHVPNWPSVDI